MRFVVGMFVILVTIMGPVAGQEIPTDCDPDGLVAVFMELANRDGAITMDELALLTTEVDQMKATCDGLVFEGSGPLVLGPVLVPTGVYRAVATTEGYLIADVVPVSGSCEATGFGSMFNLSQGQAVEGAEVLFMSDTCRMMIQVSNVRQPWELRFERIE